MARFLMEFCKFKFVRSVPFNHRLLLLLIILFSGCQKDNAVNEDQKILFQYSYTNWAWVPNNQGLLITGDGSVLLYDNPEKWNFPDSQNELTQAQVEENLSYCTPTRLKIPQGELQKYAKFINNFASSKVSAPVSRGADMGAFSYLCFQFSKSSNNYKTVTIRVRGDWEYENLNYFSKKTVDWLDIIRSEL